MTLQDPRRLCIPALPIAVAALAAGTAFAQPSGAEPAFGPGATLCIESVSTPLDDDSDPRVGMLEEAVSTRLQVASFHVVGSEQVTPIAKRHREAATGYFDPATGAIVREVYDAGMRELAASYRDELGCDYLIDISVVPVLATFANGTAHWDGTRVDVSSVGRRVMNALAGVSEYGTIGALSLWIEVSTLDRELVSFRSAGLQPLVRFAVGVDSDLAPEDTWFADEHKVGVAASSALGRGAEALLARARELQSAP